MKSPKEMSAMIRSRKKKAFESDSEATDPGTKDDIQAKRGYSSPQEDKRDDDGANSDLELARHGEDDQEDSVKPMDYAFGGRVLDSRPGYSQGPMDSDLQDKEIERQNETTKALDKNMPKKHDQGQHLSNSSEQSEEMDEQKIHENRNDLHENNEKELLRKVRIRKSMGR
jgi:hypothetical protein